MLCNSLFIYKNVNTDLSIPFHFCFSVRNIEENNTLCREKYLKSAIFKGLKKKKDTSDLLLPSPDQQAAIWYVV